jgi:hypothetical protein
MSRASRGARRTAPAVTGTLLPRRAGVTPVIAGPGPSEQLTQVAPAYLQEGLLLLGSTLPGVAVRPSAGCVPGSRAWHLSPSMAHGPAGSFLSGTEFGHVHPSYDGSVHLVLPPDLTREVVGARWGIPSGPAVLLFGPRDDDEAEFIGSLVRVAHREAAGRNRPRPA